MTDLQNSVLHIEQLRRV